MICAFACENDTFDAEVYRKLLEIEIEEPVTRWQTDMKFTGWHAVRTQLPLFVQNAQDAGVKYVLAAIDNDGGARRHLPHVATHDREAQLQDPTGCRQCRLASWLPEATAASVCLAVPVQTLEVWLLAARGHEFSAPSPEQVYDRPGLKKALFGKALSGASRTAVALEILGGDRATLRARLLERPSYRMFSQAAVAWKP